MMKVQTDKLAKILGVEFIEELRVWRAVEHDVYGLITARQQDDDDSFEISCKRILEISLEHGIAPATKLFESCTGNSKISAYQINAGMVYVATNADGDIWTKDGYVLTGSDIKLIRRTYERQLPLQYASDKGLYVW